MKILVLVKQVPDTYGERHLSTDTGRVIRDGVENVIDEVGERALEVALQYKDANKDTQVTIATMGPKGTSEAIKKALAMGADDAVHVLDDTLAGADLGLTAEVLSAVATKVGFDLIITGNESTDGRGGVMPAMIAEKLGVPHATFLNSVAISGSGVSGQRQTEAGTLDVSAPLPAVISITERGPEARFPSFKGLLGAKKKPVAIETFASLGVTAPAGKSEIVSATARPPREAGVKITDDSGDSAAQLVAFLASNRVI